MPFQVGARQPARGRAARSLGAGSPGDAAPGPGDSSGGPSAFQTVACANPGSHNRSGAADDPTGPAPRADPASWSLLPQHPRRTTGPTRPVERHARFRSCSPAALRNRPVTTHMLSPARRDGVSPPALDRVAALDRLHQRVSTSKSGLRVTVQSHPSPPSSQGPFARPTAPREGQAYLPNVHNVRRSYT